MYFFEWVPLHKCAGLWRACSAGQAKTYDGKYYISYMRTSRRWKRNVPWLFGVAVVAWPEMRATTTTSKRRSTVPVNTSVRSHVKCMEMPPLLFKQQYNILLWWPSPLYWLHWPVVSLHLASFFSRLHTIFTLFLVPSPPLPLPSCTLRARFRPDCALERMLLLAWFIQALLCSVCVQIACIAFGKD